MRDLQACLARCLIKTGDASHLGAPPPVYRCNSNQKIRCAIYRNVCKSLSSHFIRKLNLSYMAHGHEPNRGLPGVCGWEEQKLGRGIRTNGLSKRSKASQPSIFGVLGRMNRPRLSCFSQPQTPEQGQRRSWSVGVFETWSCVAACSYYEERHVPCDSGIAAWSTRVCHTSAL